MNTMKRVASAAIVASSLFAPSAFAELTGNVGVASQYIFRGISFGDPQVSGGVDWSSGGVYAGTWISSAGGEQEVDFYGGWANDLIDVGYIYYYFPDKGALATEDAGEVYASLSSGPFSAAIWYAPAGFTNTDDDEYVYVEGNLDIGLTDKVTLGLHVGVTENTGSAFDNAPETTFMDYAATLGFGDLYIMASMLDYDINAQLENEPTITVGYGWSFDDL